MFELLTAEASKPYLLVFGFLMIGLGIGLLVAARRTRPVPAEQPAPTGVGGWQLVALVLGIIGLGLIGLSMAGSTTTASDCGIAVGKSVGGNVEQDCTK